jgi:magnesium chelatase family protein
MSLARAWAVALVGIEGRIVEVEAHLAQGLPGFVLVGLPDTALSESRDRVRAAVVNSGRSWPGQRITVNLFPASLPKHGSAFDLAIAAAVLSAQGVLPPDSLAGTVLHGELGLDGRVRAVRGVLPAAVAASAVGIQRLVVAEANAAEAALIPRLEVLGVRSLAQLVAVLRGEEVPAQPAVAVPAAPEEGCRLDLTDVLGQTEARHALEVAAAGGHHLLLSGSPGAGKTMLAERLPSLLPELDLPGALEATAVHSIAGALSSGTPLVTRAPYQAPHHSASVAAIVGGGSGMPRPGAASLAHRGVLFLDEAPEFRGGVLDALRQPLESGEIVVARAAAQVRYPARFQLVLAANPCPCGNAVGRGLDCTCTPLAKRRYLGKLSGPLLDRIDLRLAMYPVTAADLSADLGQVEPSAVVAARVREARERAARRLAGTPWRVNADVPGPELRRRWPLPPTTARGIAAGVERGELTARGADRVLRVAWTLADLAGRDRPDQGDVAMAKGLRDHVRDAA